MDLKPGNFTSQSAREICRDPASESDRFRRQDASRGEWWGLAIAFSPDPELGNRPRRARPLAAHNADNPAGGSPAMVNDDKPSSYNRRG